MIWGILIGVIGLFVTLYYLHRYIITKKLRKQKSVLEPIWKLKIEDFVTINWRSLLETANVHLALLQALTLSQKL